MYSYGLFILLALIAARGAAAEPTPIVSASSVHSTLLHARYAIDGNPKTRWASAVGDPGWLMVDFGKTCTLDRVTIAWEAAYAAKYKLQMAGDDKKWTTLFHQRNGKGGTENLKDLKGRGRYLRIQCTKPIGWGLCSIWELRFDNPEITAALARAREKAPPPGTPRRMDLGKEEREKLAGFGVRDIVFAVRGDSKDGHWYANLGYYSYDENKMLYGKGGRLCTLNVEAPSTNAAHKGKMTVLIDDPEGTIRDPVVHYDAKKILFSWRKADSKVFHLYECDMDGKNIRQLTDGIYDDIEPCYLPDGGIMFVSGRGKRYVNCWLTQVAVLYRCDGDGRNIRQISANVEHDNTPWVLPDGRIIYQRWEYVDRSQVDYHHLWTANPDGTGQMVYFGNMHRPGLYIDAKPIPGTDKVLFINSPGHGGRDHSGKVAIVTDKLGPDNHAALRDLTAARDFRDPWPLSEDFFIVARRREILAMNGSGQTSSIYTLPPEFANENIQEPRPVIKRTRERIIPPAVNLAKKTGQLILNNVYIGRNMTGVEKGDIKKLLVLESLPKPINFTGGMDPLTYGGSFTLERVLGTIPVEEDGSAFMELPANRALFFVALDENDNSVKRMQSFLTVMPGEVTSCVGCHEERSATPANDSGVGRLLAFQRPPRPIEPIPGIPDVFDYPRDIQPILDKHCIKCHDYDKRKGDVILTGDRGPIFSHSYVTVTLRKQVADGRNLARSNYAPRTLGTSASPLMEKIAGGHHKVLLSPHEQNMIRYWIESAACYPGTYAALGHGSIGGYQQNSQINRDEKWPTAGAFAESVQNRCVHCHKKELGLPTPKSISDEIGISFWRFDLNDKRFKFSRHLLFNLTRPDKSLMLLAPLSEDDGGYGLCRIEKPVAEGAEETTSVSVFENTSDPDYQAMLAHIAAGKEFLENTATRFDMPNFKPRPEYFREMKRYGVLPADFDPETDPYDAYDIDRKYWKMVLEDSI